MKKLLVVLLAGAMTCGLNAMNMFGGDETGATNVAGYKQEESQNLYSMETKQKNTVNDTRVKFKDFHSALNDIMKDSSLSPEQKVSKIKKDIYKKSLEAKKTAMMAIRKEFDKQMLKADQSEEIADYIHAMEKEHKTDAFKREICMMANNLRHHIISALKHLQKQMESKSVKTK